MMNIFRMVSKTKNSLSHFNKQFKKKETKRGTYCFHSLPHPLHLGTLVYHHRYRSREYNIPRMVFLILCMSCWLKIKRKYVIYVIYQMTNFKNDNVPFYNVLISLVALRYSHVTCIFLETSHAMSHAMSLFISSLSHVEFR